MKLIIAILLLLPFSMWAQVEKKPDVFKQGMKRSIAQAMLDDGYTLNNGWTLHEDDTLQLGVGTMPNKTFAFLHKEYLDILGLEPASRYSKVHMDSKNNHGIVVIKGFRLNGHKKFGYEVQIITNLRGDLAPYTLDIYNAIESGEIIPPPQYRSVKTSASTAPVSKADELKKLHELKEQGVLTQEEFDSEKQKILSQ